MILIINTANETKVFIALISDTKLIFQKSFSAPFRQAEKLLVAIDKMLVSTKASLPDLKGVAVVAGPGPFTALRIGVVTANTLAWSLKIPVVDIKMNEFRGNDDLAALATKKIKVQKKRGIVLPFYGKEPNITKKKSSA